VACELAFKVVNVPADFGALASQGGDDERFGHCLFVLSGYTKGSCTTPWTPAGFPLAGVFFCADSWEFSATSMEPPRSNSPPNLATNVQRGVRKTSAQAEARARLPR